MANPLKNSINFGNAPQQSYQNMQQGNNMMGGMPQNNLFTAENKQRFDSMINMLNSSQNKDQMLAMLFSRNPEAKAFIDAYKNNSPEQLVRLRCQQLGYNVDDVLRFISQR